MFCCTRWCLGGWMNATINCIDQDTLPYHKHEEASVDEPSDYVEVSPMCPV